ncbi:TetR/AcrR family transcriptional repressor of nem operon [Rhodoblastus acidophilus]|uniref:TetR/AcrR family transcriptional regulator n=1 Tax=Rhodoblastus acidophilus TaxID=1074 RepID=UPI0022254ABF|nr:TetR/AcrR family transcriptional regulator [Rhodoblastus acidophilus]MCW2318137.1 TetR/AcrR family transcriptional repressor of nem operon [Rhodoblastus acidophilus]
MGAQIPETKRRLIAAALELIWRSSYGSVSVDDICKAADVRKGSFYHFFPSKADLAVAAMDHADIELRATYDRIFSPASPPLQRLENLAAFIYDAQKESAEKYGHVCGCPCASLGSEMGAQEPEIRAKFDEQRRHKTRYYQNVIRDLVAEGLLPADADVKAKADELFAYLMGRVMLARIENDLEPLRRDLKHGIFRTLGIAAETIPAA